MIPEPSQKIRNFAKALLAIKADPHCETTMGWFRAGGWYMDAVYTMVFALKDDDPFLAKVVESLTSGRLYENEVVAENLLRFGISNDEIGEFMRSTSPSMNFLLHARALVHAAAKEKTETDEAVSKLSPLRIFLSALKVSVAALGLGICTAVEAAVKRRRRKR